VSAEAALGKARASLEAARVLLESGFPANAVTGAYYAAFHASRAALTTAGLRARTHRGVHVLINERLVREGRLPADFARWLALLSDARTSADYDDGVTITPAQAREAIDLADRMVAAANGYVSQSQA
jgi:uncharacterized protein (UPF0332 family)